jgi:hypothetical protein
MFLKLDQKGFTLLDAVIAAGVLGLGMMAYASLQGNLLFQGKRNDNKSQAVTLAQDKLESIKSLSRTVDLPENDSLNSPIFENEIWSGSIGENLDSEGNVQPGEDEYKRTWTIKKNSKLHHFFNVSATVSFKTKHGLPSEEVTLVSQIAQIESGVTEQDRFERSESIAKKLDEEMRVKYTTCDAEQELFIPREYLRGFYTEYWNNRGAGEILDKCKLEYARLRKLGKAYWFQGMDKCRRNGFYDPEKKEMVENEAITSVDLKGNTYGFFNTIDPKIFKSGSFQLVKFNQKRIPFYGMCYGINRGRTNRLKGKNIEYDWHHRYVGRLIGCKRPAHQVKVNSPVPKNWNGNLEELTESCDRAGATFDALWYGRPEFVLAFNRAMDDLVNKKIEKGEEVKFRYMRCVDTNNPFNIHNNWDRKKLWTPYFNCINGCENSWAAYKKLSEKKSSKRNGIRVNVSTKECMIRGIHKSFRRLSQQEAHNAMHEYRERQFNY